jgi:hypothetical protein
LLIQKKIPTASYGFSGKLLQIHVAALTANNSPHQKSNMAVDKPEVLTAQQRDEIIEKFQRQSRHLKTAINEFRSRRQYNGRHTYLLLVVGHLEFQVTRDMAGGRK